VAADGVRIAIVTWSGLPELTSDDRHLVEPLESLGAAVSAVSWDDPSADWASFDAIVIRSTWDYHTRYAEFVRWLDHLEAVRAKVWNPVPILRWNTHKGYLLDLHRRGVPVVPTELLAPGQSVREAMASRGWSRAVIKPAVSASGYQTRVVDHNDAEDSDLELLVQPFVDEVVARGEWSFIFINGDFSHAAIKRAAPGDFRVQHDFGGTAVAVKPSPSLLDQARGIVATIEEPWLYARVDAVEREGRLVLMELELTEPALFFDLSPGAAERMAKAIATLSETTPARSDPRSR
jgi:glutathione synthase/RimK-type ligase-like ATP-grasp enzyme